MEKSFITYCPNCASKAVVVENNFKIQCKFTTQKRGNLYYCHIRKSGSKINGKQKFIPYNCEDNIDFVIIEIDGKQRNINDTRQQMLPERHINNQETDKKEEKQSAAEKYRSIVMVGQYIAKFVE